MYVHWSAVGASTCRGRVSLLAEGGTCRVNLVTRPDVAHRRVARVDADAAGPVGVHAAGCHRGAGAGVGFAARGLARRAAAVRHEGDRGGAEVGQRGRVEDDRLRLLSVCRRLGLDDNLQALDL